MSRRLLLLAALVLLVVGIAAPPAAADSLTGGNVGDVYVMANGASNGTVGYPQIRHTRVAMATGLAAPPHGLPAGAMGVKVRCYRNGAYAGQSSTYYSPAGLYSVTKSRSCTTSSSGGYTSRSYLYTYKSTYYALKTSWSPGHNF